VPLVDQIAHRLSDQVRADGERLELVVRQDLPPSLGVVLVLEALIYVEVIPPARQLHAVVPEAFGLGADLVERKVGPLAGEKGDGTGHE
jgi:hypothetical protein